MAHPAKLQEIIDFFEFLSDDEKRENLIAYADQTKDHEPKPGETFSLEDVRKDEECADTVGIYLIVSDHGQATFRITLGPHVQTLTKAMAAILCQGLNGSSPQEILDIEQDFVPKIVGSELVRVRSQTVYYVLSRMKGAAQVYLNRLRAQA